MTFQLDNNTVVFLLIINYQSLNYAVK